MNVWFGKFIRLLYIAYQYCEYDLRNVAYLTIGAISGIFLLILCSPIISHNQLGYRFMLIFNAMALWNVGLAIVFLFQIAISVIMYFAMIHVAYVYDNKSWGYVHNINNLIKRTKEGIQKTVDVVINQLDLDEIESKIQAMNHEREIEELIKEMKK